MRLDKSIVKLYNALRFIEGWVGVLHVRTTRLDGPAHQITDEGRVSE